MTSHWSLLAHKGHWSSASIHSLVVVVVVGVVVVVVGALVVVVVGVVVVVVGALVVLVVEADVVLVVFTVGPAQTPQEIRQFANIYSGLSSHCPVSAHRGHSSLSSAHALAVAVGVVVLVVGVVGIAVILRVLVLFKVTPPQNPQDNAHSRFMKSAFLSHSPHLAHTGQRLLVSTHSVVVLVVLTVVELASVTVLVVLVTPTAVEVKSTE